MVHEAIRRGLKPFIAGRSEAKLLSLTQQYQLESRSFDTSNIGDNLHDIDVILNCAGPFVSTAANFVEACIKNHIHILISQGKFLFFNIVMNKINVPKPQESYFV